MVLWYFAHKDLVASLAIRIESLIAHVKPPITVTKINERKVLSRRLKRLQECLSTAMRQLALCQVKKETRVDSSNMMNNCVTTRKISPM